MVEERVVVDGGELVLVRGWLDKLEAERYFAALRGAVAWEQSTVFIAGRSVRIPRLNAWYGDPGCGYGYSGKYFEPLPWNDALAHLKTRVQNSVDAVWPPVPFAINSALLNLYRCGSDSVGWHADDEAALGPRPQIASVSLGAERRFVFKHRTYKNERMEFNLCSGSLLLMLGDIQRHWLHALPKTRRVVEERINITFRQVFATGRQGISSQIQATGAQK